MLLLVAGAGLGAAYAWTRTQFYVGVAGDQVAIYQGLADAVPVVPLSRVYEVQPLAVSGTAAVLRRAGARKHRGARPGLGPGDGGRADRGRRTVRRGSHAVAHPDHPGSDPRPTARPERAHGTASAVVTAPPSPTAAPTEPEC